MTNKEAIEVIECYFPTGDALELATKALEYQDRERWIPVSEGLPPEHEESQDRFDPDTLAIIDTDWFMASDLVLVTVKDYDKDTLFTCDDMTVNGKWVNFSGDEFEFAGGIMKLSKEILNLIDKRMKYGELANSYDSKVQEWCNCHNIDISDVVTDYGCMLTSEPYNYAKLTIERIENT